MSNPTIGQNWGGTFAAGTTQTITSVGAVANGSTIDLTVITKKASGSANISVGDLQNNNYTLIKTVNDNTVGSSCRRYVAQNVVGGIIALEVDCTTSVEMSLYAVEIKPPANGAVTLDSSYSNTATAATSIEVDVQDTGQLGNGVLVIGSATQKSGTGIVITPGLTSLFQDNGSGTIAGISVDYQNGVSLASAATFACTWSFASSAGLAAIAITYGSFLTTSSPAKGPMPAARYTAQDILLPVGTLGGSIPEHSGGTAATSSGSAFTMNKEAAYTIPGVQISKGAGSGIFIPYTGPLAAVFTSLSFTRGAAGSLMGADDASHGANGAWSVSNDSSNNVTGTLITAGATNTATSIQSEGMGTVTIVLGVIYDGTNLIVRVNGFEVARHAVTGGSPLTISPGSQLRILNAFVSGGDATPTSGTWHETRPFASVPSAADMAIIESDMAWPMGPALTLQYRGLAHNNTGFEDAAIAVESADGIAWVNPRHISYNPPAGDVRDIAPLWWDASDGTMYYSHTMFNFSNVGSTFAIFKTRADIRLAVPHCLVDCSIGGPHTGTVDPTTHAPWGGAKGNSGAPLTTAPVDLFYSLSQTANAARVPVIDLKAGTFGTIVAATGNDKESSFNCYPNSFLNNSANYRRWGGPVTGCTEAPAVDGTYVVTQTIDNTSFKNTNEWAWGLNIPEQSVARLYTNGSTGAVFWTTTGNGDAGTWSDAANPTATTGLHPGSGGAFDIAQLGPMDFKVLGLLPSTPSSASLTPALIAAGVFDDDLVQ